MTEVEFLAFLGRNALSWSVPESNKLTRIFRNVADKLKGWDVPLPPTVLLIKSTGAEEGQAVYTRQKAIILPQQKLGSSERELEHAMLHELFHLMSRHDPELRKRLYRVVGFEPVNSIEYPRQLQDRKITNPDGYGTGWLIEGMSCPGLRAAAAWLQEEHIGKPLWAHIVWFEHRPPIGKCAPFTSTDLDYDLWCGLAPLEPLTRPKLHYDWHWFWSTGDGALGNSGIHAFDACRMFLPGTVFPQRLICLGGRFTYDDAAQTPNTLDRATAVSWKGNQRNRSRGMDRGGVTGSLHVG